MAIQGNETVEQPIILPAQDPQYRTIHVSRQKKTVHFFANLTKRFLTTDEIIELSGLGLAIVTVIETTQILRKSGHIYVEGKLFLIPKVFFSNMRLLLTFLTTCFFFLLSQPCKHPLWSRIRRDAQRPQRPNSRYGLEERLRLIL